MNPFDGARYKYIVAFQGGLSTFDVLEAARAVANLCKEKKGRAVAIYRIVEVERLLPSTTAPAPKRRA